MSLLDQPTVIPTAAREVRLLESNKDKLARPREEIDAERQARNQRVAERIRTRLSRIEDNITRAEAKIVNNETKISNWRTEHDRLTKKLAGSIGGVASK